MVALAWARACGCALRANDSKGSGSGAYLSVPDYLPAGFALFFILFFSLKSKRGMCFKI